MPEREGKGPLDSTDYHNESEMPPPKQGSRLPRGRDAPFSTPDSSLSYACHTSEVVEESETGREEVLSALQGDGAFENEREPFPAAVTRLPVV